MNSTADELSSLRRVVQRGTLLLLPFLALQLIELFVLPIDFFSFRVWEAALSAPYRYPGAFFPNLHVWKAKEYGDRYRTGDPQHVQAKSVEWYTDPYGWRNRPEVAGQAKYDVVVLGDSNIVGSFLDQKDTLTEVLSSRANKTAYSYSMGGDHISLFFKDARVLKKSPDLVVVETKVGNWSHTSDSYLRNFRELPDGSLDLVDRSAEMDKYHSLGRNHLLEQIDARLAKQPMFHWLKASMASDFASPTIKSAEVFVGRLDVKPAINKATWRPLNGFVSNGKLLPLPNEPQPAIKVRATGPNSFWHTDRFVAAESDGNVVLRFDAMNSVTPTKHRVWIFEDGHYRTVGEFIAPSNWRTFEIPIATNPGSVLEFQIDQPDTWQWLSLRDVQVIGGSALPMVTGDPAVIPMSAWSGNSANCDAAEANAADCRQWAVAGKTGYVQTPILPPPGAEGMLIRFEARSDRPATAYSAIYLFEGARYLKVAQYAFGPEWREYSLLLKPDRNLPLKVQVDFPEQVDALAIRNFRTLPVERLNAARGTN